MKKLTKILCALLVVLTMSCAKDGATGPQGPAGTNGTNGTNGNANVTVYNFDTDFILSSLSFGVKLKCLIKGNSRFSLTLIESYKAAP